MRVILGSVVLLVAAAALYVAGQPILALLFAGLVLANTVLLFVLGGPWLVGEAER